VTKLLPLSEAALLCEHAAQVVNETAHLPLQEPGWVIEEFDRQRGNADLADPLRTAHRMAEFYLAGAGDFLYSIGTLLALEQPTLLSPAVLARSAGEYASRAKYLSSLDDGPEMRISKVWSLFMDGFTRMGASKPSADPTMVDMVRRPERWRSGQTLPKSKVPDYTKLVERLSPQMGRERQPVTAARPGSLDQQRGGGGSVAGLDRFGVREALVEVAAQGTVLVGDRRGQAGVLVAHAHDCDMGH
jgi:hypothetical protein